MAVLKLPIAVASTITGLMSINIPPELFACPGTENGICRAPGIDRGSKGELAKIAGQIAELGGNIIAVATFVASDTQHREITMKIQGVKKDALVPALEKAGAQIMDVREVTAEYEPKLISSR